MSESTRIDSITIVDRHRKDFGDLIALADSIKNVGLLQPVVITPDLRLVAGERRIRAALSLGWATIPTRIVSNLTEAADLLRAERDENVCRQEMTVSERVSLARQIEELEKPRAAERQASGQFGSRSGSPEPDRKEVRAADIAGDAVGMSRVTYQRAKYVVDVASGDTESSPEAQATAQDAVKRMDAGEIGPSRAMRLVNASVGAPDANLSRDVLAGKAPVKKSPLDLPTNPTERRIRRAEIASEMAASGAHREHVARHLGITREAVGNIAKDFGITFPADIVGRTRRIDSMRVVRETVLAADGLASTVDLVHDLTGLDPREAEQWTASLDQSIRALNRLNKKIKEALL